MYLEHFGLSQAPFKITPHTEFFFVGANRGATLEALLYAILNGEGLIKVSGEVGSGKTMLSRVLLHRLPESVVTVYLAIPSLTRGEILHAIAQDLRLDTRGLAAAALVRAVQGRLIALHAAGRQVVVIVDEAHAMPAETLEEIRMLSNLETSQHKLLQIVLFGQPELDSNLRQPHLRQLKERITQNFRLPPLRCPDVGEYLDFRLQAAGYRGPELFSPACVALIAKASLGLTRRVNILADKTLLSAYSQSTRSVDTRHVKAAIRDSEFSSPYRIDLNRYSVAGAAMLVGIALGAALMFGVRRPPATPELAQTSSPTSAVYHDLRAHPPPETTDASPILAAQASVSNIARNPTLTYRASGAGSSSAATLRAPANGLAIDTTGGITAKVSARNPAGPPVNLAPTSAATSSRPASFASTVAATEKPAQGSGATASQIANVELNTADAKARNGDSDANGSAQWLQAQPDHRFAIQLMVAKSELDRSEQLFVEQAAQALGKDEVHQYAALVGGQAQTSIVYGSFQEHVAALKALETLPRELKRYRPYVRSFGALKSELRPGHA
jgi:MSHA biogenesis protein MshM